MMEARQNTPGRSLVRVPGVGVVAGPMLDLACQRASNLVEPGEQIEVDWMGAPDIDRFVDQYHLALDEFFRGDPQFAEMLYSHREDVSLANPFGPVAIGWEKVKETMERAASNYRDGGATAFETLATYVTSELAYLVEVERFEARVGGAEEMTVGALRVTSVLRPEDGVWKIVHRHADPITAPRSAESVIQR